MPIHEDKQMQHVTSNGLQRPSGDSDEKVTRGGCKPCPSWDKVGALCATDYKWVQQEQVEQGKIIPVIR